MNIWTHGKLNILGVGFCFLLFCSGFTFSGDLGIYANLTGFIIVIGGCTTSLFLAYRVERLMILARVILASYARPVISPRGVIKLLVILSVKQRLHGSLSLEREEEDASIFFLRRAIGLLVDSHKPEQIREALDAEMFFFKKRREESLRILRTLAEVAPAFGLIGSVVGLIGMLHGLGDSTTIISTIPIALTSTLYGIILANMICNPIAANIRERTSQELLLQRLIPEGIISIASDVHPQFLDNKLKSFLTPAARKEEVISIARIKKRLEERRLRQPMQPRE